MEETAKAREKGMVIQPAHLRDGKSVSWNEQGPYVAPANVAQGEYANVTPGGDSALRLQQLRWQPGRTVTPSKT